MAEESSFFNSRDGDRKYNASHLAEYWSDLIGNGIFNGGNALKVEVDYRMDIAVSVGKGWINGYKYYNKDSPKVITIQPADVQYSRIDRVVLQLNLEKEQRWIRAVVKTGTPSASPAAPELQRDNAIWELGLADIVVNPNAKEIVQSNITDLRLNDDYCGIVKGLVDQPDLTEIFNQYTDEWLRVKSEMDNNRRIYDEYWADFVETCETVWTGYQAQWLDRMARFDAWFEKALSQVEELSNTDFEDKSTKIGYTLVTTEGEGGSIVQEWQNKPNGHVLARKVTTFEADGSITETQSWPDLNLQFAETTSFLDDGTIEQEIKRIGVITA